MAHANNRLDQTNTNATAALWAPVAYLPEAGWTENVLLAWNDDGKLTQVGSSSRSDALAAHPSVIQASGPVIPGMTNVHSHAFQSAMAGLTEFRGKASDSFWSWRDLMYRYAAHIQPDMLQAIAHWLYIVMLKAGYTSVCEFHYIHHQKGGHPYDNLAELGSRVVQSAQAAGIGMTMLPVLYQYSNFGAQAPREDQARFINTPDRLLELLLILRQEWPESRELRYGVAPHSLRAVTVESLGDLLIGLDEAFPEAPVHIHIAEQTAEVEACQQTHGTRPVAWLMDQLDVNERWCLVHATHIDEDECTRLARSAAVAGLCLTTEANLGDGIFPSLSYLSQDGRFAVGSDSHISVDWRSELRLMEYGQRLLHRQRNVLAGTQQAIVAEHLFSRAIEGGAQASGRPVSGLRLGQQADFIVLDTDHPHLAELPQSAWLSSLVFSEVGGTAIQDVYVAGRRQIADGRHADEALVYQRYRQALAHLLALA